MAAIVCSESRAHDDEGVLPELVGLPPASSPATRVTVGSKRIAARPASCPAVDVALTPERHELEFQTGEKRVVAVYPAQCKTAIVHHPRVRPEDAAMFRECSYVP